jgi:hypothetical protein
MRLLLGFITKKSQLGSRSTSENFSFCASLLKSSPFFSVSIVVQYRQWYQYQVWKTCTRIRCCGWSVCLEQRYRDKTSPTSICCINKSSLFQNKIAIILHSNNRYVITQNHKIYYSKASTLVAIVKSKIYVTLWNWQSLLRMISLNRIKLSKWHCFN